MTGPLCCADLHVGAGAAHRRDHLADQDDTLDQIIQTARDNDVDSVLIAGDVFHRVNPTPAEMHVFSRFVKALEMYGIPAIAIVGNAGHDQVNGETPTALELFASDWFRVSRKPEVIRAAGDVAVCTLPSVPVHRLVAERGGGDRGELNEIAAALLVEAAAELRAQVADGWPAVLMGHWSVSGASLPSGLPVADLLEPVLPLDALEEQGWNAMVFGHIHRPQMVGNGSFYCGSPMCHDFGEAAVDHGVWILHAGADPRWSADPWSTEFVPLRDRAFVTVDLDLSHESADDLTGILALVIAAEGDLTDAVVRVAYRATEEQHRRVDLVALQRLLDEAGVHRVHGGVRWDPVRVSRARVEGVDESLDRVEAVRMWCAANEVSEGAADRLVGMLGESAGAGS